MASLVESLTSTNSVSLKVSPFLVSYAAGLLFPSWEGAKGFPRAKLCNGGKRFSWTSDGRKGLKGNKSLVALEGGTGFLAFK